MYGIQNIGFPHAVQTRKTIEPLRERQGSGLIIFKIEKLDAAQVHFGFRISDFGASNFVFLSPWKGQISGFVMLLHALFHATT